MNDQAQMAAVLLAGFFATGDPVPQEAGLAGADILTSRAKPEIVEISSGSCAIVTAHQPREDVAFKSGVTINGAKTVPANIAHTDVYALRPIYEFDVRINPLPNSSIAVTPRMDVATVTYEPENGRIMLDGQELVWMHENALRAACESHTSVTP
ncbi:hypothetical protein QMT40_001345 [Parvibaculaceae bacterium PLY_AMNH_Bact1]|nr:hypothetical protein QMT40_001345 [Parvibaculaceae bacterium PLY_AMNH_Bact1]